MTVNNILPVIILSELKIHNKHNIKHLYATAITDGLIQIYA